MLIVCLICLHVFNLCFDEIASTFRQPLSSVRLEEALLPTTYSVVCWCYYLFRLCRCMFSNAGLILFVLEFSQNRLKSDNQSSSKKERVL